MQGAMAVVMAFACVMVSCQKDAENKVSNITLYTEALEAQPEGETLRVNYTIAQPAEGVTLDVTCEAEWVAVDVVTASFFDVVVVKNDTGAERSATLKLTYGGDVKSLNISQKAWEAPLAVKVDKVDATSVTFSVTALDETTTWIGQIVDKAWFEEMDEVDIFNEDMRYYYAMAEEGGLSLEEYLATMLSKGSHSNLRMAGLDPEWEYVVYVYGMNTIGEKTTSIYCEAFTTTAPYEGNDVTFDFNITVNRAIAHIEITPSHEGVAYYNNLITYEDFETLYGKDINVAADAVIADVIEDYAYWDYTLAETFEYNTDYLATQYEFEAMANTEYVAFAFKWNEKCERLSEVSYKWCEIGAIAPTENVITMKISNVTQSTFDIVTTTTNLDPYVIFPIPAQDSAKMRTDDAIFEYILNTYNSAYYGDYWEFSYYELAQGGVDSRISQLKPSTDYKIVIIPMNPHSFEYVGSMREGGFFTTEEAIIADIKITAGFDAYYDGDEVYELEPQYCSSWKGWVVVPMIVNIEGDCAGYLYTMFSYIDGLEDPELYSDDLLIDNLYNVGAYWSPAYFRGQWDVEMMIAAVAFDRDGNPSPVYRERFICTRDGAGDAQEFVDYYLGNISRASLGADNLNVMPLSCKTNLKQMCMKREISFLIK